MYQEELAKLACNIEIDRLGEPIGKQDQYIAAIGGITCFNFHKNDEVTAEPLGIDIATLHELEDNLLLFFTGYSRSASGILRDQNIKSQDNNADMLANLHYAKDLGYQSQKALLASDTILLEKSCMNTGNIKSVDRVA